MDEPYRTHITHDDDDQEPRRRHEHRCAVEHLLERILQAVEAPSRPPLRDVAKVTLNGTSETIIPGAGRRYAAVSVVNTHATADLWVAAQEGEAAAALAAAAPRGSAFKVPAGKTVTAPIAGTTIAICGTNAGGTLYVETYRWPTAMIPETA